MTRRNWKHYQPPTLRDALQGDKDFALERHNLSIERIAERMGEVDHWSLYKWIANGRMPLVLLPAYEHACGIGLVKRWMAASDNKLLVDMPTGRKASAGDMVELNSGFAKVLQLVTDYYTTDGSKPAETLDAIRLHMEQMEYHRKNVAQFATPELEF